MYSPSFKMVLIMMYLHSKLIGRSTLVKAGGGGPHGRPPRTRSPPGPPPQFPLGILLKPPNTLKLQFPRIYNRNYNDLGEMGLALLFLCAANRLVLNQSYYLQRLVLPVE